MAAGKRLITTADGTLAAAFGAAEWALLVATALIWGSSYLLISVALEGLRPLAVTFMRVALGLVGSCPACRLHAANLRLPLTAAAWPCSESSGWRCR